MTSEAQINNQDVLNEKVIPFTKTLSETSIALIKLLLDETRAVMSSRQFTAHLDQWKIFAKKLNTNDKLLYLKQQNCRILIIQLIREEAMSIFNSSYLNRAKIDGQYIRYLKQLGPYFFIEVIMVVSKLKTIHKHFYKRLNLKMSENHIEIKIRKILELCNQKKRSINNNKAKFLCIVEDQTDRLEITKQLGKMLRESWKRQKSKQHLQQIKEQVFQPLEVKECQENQEQQIQQIQQMPVMKQFAKHISFSAYQNNDLNLQMLNDNMMDFSMLRTLRYRDSDSEEMLFYERAM